MAYESPTSVASFPPFALTLYVMTDDCLGDDIRMNRPRPAASLAMTAASTYINSFLSILR